MKRKQIIFGIFFILLGVIALVEVLTDVNLWRFIWPLILVSIGALMLLRPRLSSRDIQVETPILGDVRKYGSWEVGQHEIWLIVGSTRLDFTDAQFIADDANIRVIGFVNDLKIILPENVGLLATSSAFVSEIHGPDIKEERILNTLDYQTPNYEALEKRVKIQTLGFVSEITIKPPLI